VNHQQLVELAARAFPDSRVDEVSAYHSVESSGVPSTAAPILVERKGELEQAHLIIGAPWPDARSDDRYAASMLGSIIGGGTSSRLWQSVREERGLAYAVGAGGSTFSDVGVFTIYAGTSPAQLDEVIDLSLKELRRSVREGVTDEELRLVKDQAISSVLLGLESSSVRAGSLARQEIIHGRRILPDEVIARVEAVTPDDVRRIARTYFNTETISLAALGNLNGFKVDRSRLEI